MQSLFLPYGQSKIHYRKNGAGDTCIVCLHGYSENSYSFEIFNTPAIARDFTTYSIDLPFHGLTEWREKEDFTTEVLWKIIHQIVTTDRQIIFAGYSMGARLVLSLYQEHPEQCQKLILIAPDGLHNNFWFRFSTSTRLGTWLFKKVIVSPATFFKLLSWTKSIKLVSKNQEKVAHHYLKTGEARRKLFKTWSYLRLFKTNLTDIKDKINRFRTPVKLIFGTNDYIIPASQGHNFCKGIEPYATVYTIEAGHGLMKESYAEEIIEAIQKRDEV